MLNKLNYKSVTMAVMGLLVTWQATNFSLDYRAIVSTLIASGLAGAGTATKTPVA